MARPKQFDPDVALERAMLTFWRRGYSNTSMDALVKETGVVRASLYSTFGNKAALFRRALDHYGAARAARVDRTAGPLAMMRQYLEGAVDDARAADRPSGCLLFGATAEYGTLDDDTRQVVDAHLERVRAFFAWCIGQRVPPEQVDGLTDVLFGVNAAVFTLARVGTPVDRLQHLIDDALARVEAAACFTQREQST